MVKRSRHAQMTVNLTEAAEALGGGTSVCRSRSRSWSTPPHLFLLLIFILFFNLLVSAVTLQAGTLLPCFTC